MSTSGVSCKSLSGQLAAADVDENESAGACTGTDGLTESLPLSSYAWFHGSVTREQAEELLASHAFLGEHVFLVRESVSFSGDYSISFLYEFCVYASYSYECVMCLLVQNVHFT